MHFLRYLIFIIISLFSVQAFAVTYKAQDGSKNSATGSTPDSACRAFYSKYITYAGAPAYSRAESGACYYTSGVFAYYSLIPDPPTKCPSSGYPIPIYFDINTPVPLRTCKQNPDGTYCITEWTGDKNKPVVISGNQYQSITHASVSEIPSPSCTPLFSQDTCNPSDPYGGCYKPPNDNCNRMADGSIYCPPDEPPPPIKSGCQNGATYCDMPPTGCGTGYVPGTFNGKQICVKNSNPPPTDPPDQPPPTDPPPITPPDPSDPPDADPPPPPPPPPSNDPLLRAILDAINAVNNKLTWLKNELVNSLNYIAKKIDVTNSKLDTTNQKLDTVNSSIKETTAAVNANGDKIKAAVDANATTVKTAVEANTNSTANKLNEVVNAINNKPVGGGGSAPDMKPTNDLLTDIKEFLTGGNLPEDKGEKIETKELNNQTFNTGLITTGGSVCPDDYPINWSTPFGTINKSISFANLCAQSSWIGYLVLAFAYMIAAGIVVRA
ncbi:virulence factor TspB C-terminal domain-related protein [Acinetobacter baumannii]|uniref:virulence factor TspB C-terminal domain-related protein n=1 Tax=Acinetobacter baumannii TaxID=470 RepID=UPI00148E9B87|nr:virulence factor TspB C-terminal domain-related protein [Acinetobacter baumannii]